jgi:CheY-like chemotaxis protein
MQLLDVVAAWGATTSFISLSAGSKIMKVLIAEDDSLSRWYLKNILIDWGYEVTACENGSDAWKSYLAGDYHLVISDWAMPEIDGIELCRKIRARNDPCYFVLLSSRVGQTGFTEDPDAGIDVYLSKPLNSHDLKSQVRMAELLFEPHSEDESEQSLLPLCAWCRRARVSKSVWRQIESPTSDDFFTYSICPDCSRQLKVASKSSAAG